MTTPSSDVCRPLPEQAGRSGSGDGGRAQDGGPGRGALGDRYELVSLLATGGMGQVWRARDTLLDRPVAVTVLRSEFTGDPTFVARFRAEARHTAVLAHRNIAALHDYERPSNGNGKGSARGNGRGKANGCGQG